MCIEDKALTIQDIVKITKSTDEEVLIKWINQSGDVITSNLYKPLSITVNGKLFLETNGYISYVDFNQIVGLTTDSLAIPMEYSKWFGIYGNNR